MLARKCKLDAQPQYEAAAETDASLLVVGSLLEVPTHTVNMTTLRSTHNLWESHSMSPYEVLDHFPRCFKAS